MNVKPPSKTALFDAIQTSKLVPLYWDVEVMRDVAHKLGGIHFSGGKPSCTPNSDSSANGLDSTNSDVSETIRDAAMVSRYLESRHSVLMLPQVLEHTSDGFTTRTLSLGSPYHRYGYDRTNTPFAVLSVRSDHELYTRLDPNTPFVSYRSDGPDDDDETWSAFGIQPFSLGLWVADMAFLMRNDKVTNAMRNWFNQNLVDNIFATEDMLVELESRASEELIEELFGLRARYNEDSMRMQANKVAYDFFYGDIRKIRLGIWKVGRGEANFSQRDTMVAVSFENGHSVLSMNVKTSQAGDIKAINNLDEVGLIRKLIQVPKIRTVIPEEVEVINQSYRDLAFTINGIQIPITVKNRRYYVFGFAVKTDEVHELIQGMCCMNDAGDMADLSKDVSLLSLQYRKFLSDGITVTGAFPVCANTTVPFIKRLWRGSQQQVAHEFPHELERRKMIVQENYTFRFERRGPRGLALVAGTKRYPVYPYDLQKVFKTEDLSYSYQAWDRGTELFNNQLAAIKKALGDITTLDAKRIIWASFKYARFAIRRSRQLLEEVSGEIGAVKEVIRVENRRTDAYVITGTSGNRYAVTDDARYRVYREVLTNEENDRWVFVCIEGKSDQSQEVDKDKLVTRMLALANDRESVGEISTLQAAMAQ